MMKSDGFAKKTAVLYIASILSALVIGVAVGYFGNTYLQGVSSGDTEVTEETDYATLSRHIYADKTTLDQASIVDKYGSYYDSALIEMQDTPPAYWVEHDIDRAFFVVQYADTVADYAQIDQTYYSLITVEQKGEDIYSNSAGMTEQELGEIYTRASLRE